MSRLFVGIMSGTSLDAADAVLVDLSAATPRPLGSGSAPIGEALRSQLSALCEPGSDGIDLAASCTKQLAHLYAEATSMALAAVGVPAKDVTAIGCHGQTVRHRPEQGFTVQLNDPALLAEMTGIDVVADFRRRDIAAGGQGAPLVPLFHDAVFRHENRTRAIVNIGGISNATVLCPGQPATGFDCGPGNLLMDYWVGHHRGARYDAGGTWARSGVVQADLLERFLRDPYLALPPPKSTGREHFGPRWLHEHLTGNERPEDVQATLLAFTTHAISHSLTQFAPGTQEVFLCGGGAQNGALLESIARAVAPARVGLTDELGLDAQRVEASAFAWLAKCCVDRIALKLGPVTGARHPCVLGAIYPR